MFTLPSHTPQTIGYPIHIDNIAFEGCDWRKFEIENKLIEQLKILYRLINEADKKEKQRYHQLIAMSSPPYNYSAEEHKKMIHSNPLSEALHYLVYHHKQRSFILSLEPAIILDRIYKSAEVDKARAMYKKHKQTPFAQANNYENELGKQIKKYAVELKEYHARGRN